jgi:2,3-bisphosphoglycerate-independent phosphoglycerate mutase
MIEPGGNRVKTSHTHNPVELIYVSEGAKGKTLKSGGKLADVAPTILKLMNIEIPAEMTATQLLEQ